MTTPENSSRKLRQASIVLYATLVLLWLSIPQSVSNWSRDYLPAAVAAYATPVAEAVETLARVVRVSAPYDWSRELFLSVTRKQ
ncbi:MAG TPA: hypothetical protein PL193_01700 [Xanthobacteraceae bacterium]|nr:hypothetical protein [Xanthobacteraceae bacterium]